ncbi:MAG TPA: pilus assembly protein N-terminal domain-containing protein, partial [Xanthobacteraceae bacterium]
MSRFAAALAHVSALLLCALPLAAVAGPAEPITVNIDQATLARIPERVATLVIGNPLIADAALQTGGILVVTGKGYGSTNLIALDRSGNVLTEKMVEVVGPRERTITVFRGVQRETYSCEPECQRRITLGDGDNFF